MIRKSSVVDVISHTWIDPVYSVIGNIGKSIFHWDSNPQEKIVLFSYNNGMPYLLI